MQEPELVGHQIGGCTIDSLLAVGTFSFVYICTNIKYQEKRVMKAIPKVSKYGEVQVDLVHAKRELDVLCRLYHPNVLRYIETVENDEFIFVFTEFCEGETLLQFLLQRTVVEYRDFVDIARQLLNAIEYIHSQNIAHRDLKLENIMISNRMKVKIIDFGLSNFTQGNSLLSTYCGSMQYVPPEIICQEPYNGKMADIWSLGIVFYSLLVGRFPWPDENLSLLMNHIKEGNLTFPYFVNQCCIPTITKMLSKMADHRPNASEILDEQWLVERTRSLGVLPQLVQLNKSDQQILEKKQQNSMKPRLLTHDKIPKLRVKKHIDLKCRNSIMQSSHCLVTPNIMKNIGVLQ